MSKMFPLLVGLLLAGCKAGATQPADARGVAQSGVQNGAPYVRPVPPADLDARLIQYFPLRGQVLREGGFARMRFTVAVNGAVTSELPAIKATDVAYAIACRRMLEASTWTPARDVYGAVVPYTGTFDCAFQQEGAPSSRTSARTELAATPPSMPDYGESWYERYGEGTIGENAGAVLQIEVKTDGRVAVLGMAPESNANVAAACRRMLEEGPPWQPALDKQGRPVPYQSPFTCRVNLDAPDKRLELMDVGASGALEVQVIAAELTERLPAFVHCFESAFGMSKKIHGKHWLAFEVSPAGAVGRMEWVERPLADEILESCVFSVARELHFPAAAAGTLADVQLEAGGVAKFRMTL